MKDEVALKKIFCTQGLQGDKKMFSIILFFIQWFENKEPNLSFYASKLSLRKE